MRPLHQSSANAWSHCPRLYALTVDRDRDPHYMPFVRGQAVHVGCEAAVKVGRGDSDREQQLAAGLAAIDDWCRANTVPPHVAGDAANIFAASLDEGSSIDYRRPYGCREDRVELAWSMNERWELIAWSEDAPGAAYSGRIDWIRVFKDRVEVVDFKSALGVVSGDDLHDSDWQARLYGLAALAAYPGVREVKFTHFRLRAGIRVSATFRRGKPWARITRDYFARVRAEIAAADISDPMVVRATPGGGCGVCPIRHQCAERADLIAHGAIEDDDSPGTIARKRSLLTPLGNELDRVLKEYAKEEDVPYGGMVYGYRPRKRLVVAVTTREFVRRALLVLSDEEVDEVLEAKAPTRGRALQLAEAELNAMALDGDHEGSIGYDVIERHALDTGLLRQESRPVFGTYIPED